MWQIIKVKIFILSTSQRRKWSCPHLPFYRAIEESQIVWVKGGRAQTSLLPVRDSILADPRAWMKRWGCWCERLVPKSWLLSWWRCSHLVKSIALPKMGLRYQNIRCHTYKPGLLLKLPAQEQPEKVDVFLLLIGAGKTGTPSLSSCCCRPERNAQLPEQNWVASKRFPLSASHMVLWRIKTNPRASFQSYCTI